MPGNTPKVSAAAKVALGQLSRLSPADLLSLGGTHARPDGIENAEDIALNGLRQRKRERMRIAAHVYAQAKAEGTIELVERTTFI